MEKPFNNNMKDIADSMGIALYARFSASDAALFLHITEAELDRLRRDAKLHHIAVTDTKVEYFGYQLLEYLLGQVSGQGAPPPLSSMPERILRSHEVQEITGMSRTTIWRMERRGEFPSRVPLSGSSVGWRKSEVDDWLASR